ncbi:MULTISPECIES: hypothetical protein [unclassified Chryseobacterium]|uniref:hypothetical protein n=1 Tax=unclassified Chryseobacterium TaxID=2593645 RepID=UPI00100B9BD8|nr:MULTISPECIES: hypothetical protein [unclassified Chryseobacterium]RXM50626.1 hypothetical protein BOQ64_17960 [Chryseobacterium sp. CH25]RXM63260.1 hypothetical protein BOQ60_18155 [Chryseobacterium sp. CH1]
MTPISPVGEADAVVKLTRGGLKAIGNLTHLKDVTVAEAVIARGGKLGNLNVIEDAYKSMKVVEIANKAAQGDEKAMTALKIIKQASSKAQKY